MKNRQRKVTLEMEFSIVENVPTPQESAFNLFSTFQLQTGEKIQKMFEYVSKKYHIS